MALGRSKRSVQAMVRKFIFDCCSCLLCLFPMYRSLLILVLPIDTGMLVIESTQWKLANDCIPTFFIKADAPRHTPGVVKVEDPYLVIGVNDIVITPYGTCRCKKEARAEDGFYTLEPIRWILANKRPPQYFMQKQYLTLYQKEEDTPTFKFKKYIKICYKCKNDGNHVYIFIDYFDITLFLYNTRVTYIVSLCHIRRCDTIQKWRLQWRQAQVLGSDIQHGEDGPRPKQCSKS